VQEEIEDKTVYKVVSITRSTTRFGPRRKTIGWAGTMLALTPVAKAAGFFGE
jgi:hypothetical protein